MTSTPVRPQPGRTAVRCTGAASRCNVGVGDLEAFRDLEEFWPSRRGHAFDELCR